MDEAVPTPVPPPDDVVPIPPWHGPTAFFLLAVVGSMGPDITPSRYYPELDHYIPRYVVLSLSVGFSISAVRSQLRIDRIFGIASLVTGGWMVMYIIRHCIRITGGEFRYSLLP